MPKMLGCQDPSSMRFIPIYHDAKSCEKSGLNKAQAEHFPVHDRKRSQDQSCCSDSSMRFVPLYAAIRGTSSPRPVSVSCDSFATSSPFPSAPRSSLSKSFQQTNSSDSGILVDSPRFYVDSSFGTPEKSSPFMSSEPRKVISILKRGQSSADDLNGLDVEEAKRTVSRDLSTMLERLVIPEETEGSTDDEGLLDIRKWGEHRLQRVPTSFGSLRRRFLRRPSSKVSSTSKTFKTKGTTGCSRVVPSRRTQLCDDNNNSQAEDCPSTVSASRRASDIRQNLSLNTSTKYVCCSFCKSNNEPEDFMRSHNLKTWEPISHRYMLTCPVLRKYVCPRCGATGDAAHTLTYCPETIREVGYRPRSLISKFRQTTHDSSGRKRTQSLLPHLNHRSV